MKRLIMVATLLSPISAEAAKPKKPTGPIGPPTCTGCNEPIRPWRGSL